MIDNKTINLNAWEMAVVLHTINQLQQTTLLPQVHIDNWEVNETLFWTRLKEVSALNFKKLLPKGSRKLLIDPVLLDATQLIPEHRADETYTIVGAASILAKNASDAQYDEYKKIYGNFGSGSPADPTTRYFVWKHRKNPPPIIRQSWNTYKTLAKLDDISQDRLYNRNKPPNLNA